MKTTKTLFGILSITAALAMQVHAQSFLTNGLVAYYPFNGNANDAGGNGHNGVVNGTSISPANNQLGVLNAALHFGGGSYISVTPTPFNVNSNWTISLWCNLDADATNYCNFVSTGRDVAGGLNVRHGGNGTGQTNWWQYFVNWPNGCFYVAKNNPNSWNMLTCVRNGYSCEMFLNDALVVSNTVVGTTLDTGALWFGRHQMASGPYDLLGSLSETRIYNRALSASDVQQLYAYESGPWVNLIKAVKPSFSNLTLTTNYQLQVSGDLNNWTNQGSTFTASNTTMIYPQYWDVDNWGKLFFRLQVAP